ncbi:ATP-binding cassette domain-containing protein [Micromonospora endolithica]|uniref:ABC transporter ATP-binding protein n=1 Tax=Micromonospora endolithica TaxID=230091 RepID=A0A3A9Z0Q3_9ACTN|nr:ABC transporter ATP-binding protein [Micromonospora endolithica]RKN41514.1 ABC transporter ATP-binding protein [Micromonospora endolithica]TWJ21958.1 ATP-binding cassette subfamily C protein [Micromonospora endolithica]
MSHPGVRRTTWNALRARRRELGGLAGWSVVESLPALLGGVLVARAVDQGFLVGRFGTGLAWLAGLAAAVLVGAVGTGRVYRGLGAVVEPFRDELATRVVRAALDGATRPGGRADSAAVTRLTHQVEVVRDTFGGLLMVVRGFLFTAGSALLGLLSLAPLLAGAVAVPLVAGLVVFAAGLPAMVAHQRAQVRAGEDLGRSAATALGGHRDVVACGAQDRVVDDVGRRVTAQARTERTLARMAALRSLSLGVGGWLPVVVLLLAVPWLVRNGMSTGAVLGALVYVTTGLQPALHAIVVGVGGGGLRYVVTLDRILRACPVPGDDAGPTAGTAPPPVAHAAPGTAAPPAVRLRGVTFRYGPHARPVLADLTLALSAGEHLAVVGPSGAGKSTLAALIAGLARPDSGTVHLAGAPVAALAPAALARLRVLVPQEGYVRSGSLDDNLRYLCPDVDEAALERAVDALGARPLVSRLGGLGAAIEPGALSAGERQLVAAVRAYVAPAPLVILDEATCHLDPVLEATVEDAFGRRPGTLVVVAHRISSATRADRVLVFDDDGPVLGTHQELLARSPTYRELVGLWEHVPVPSGVPLGGP